MWLYLNNCHWRTVMCLYLEGRITATMFYHSCGAITGWACNKMDLVWYTLYFIFIFLFRPVCRTVEEQVDVLFLWSYLSHFWSILGPVITNTTGKLTVFSDSLIIHWVQTAEVINMIGIWIPGLTLQIQKTWTLWFDFDILIVWWPIR